MKLNVFFSSSHERIEFVEAQFKLEKMIIKDNAMVSPIIPGIASLKLKKSFNNIPGYWLEFIFNKTSNGRDLFQQLNSVLPQNRINGNVFYPKSHLAIRELEREWIDKYGLTDEAIDEDKWRLFYLEVKAHLKSGRFNIAYSALIIFLKYNPFFLRKYKRYYILEEIAYAFEEAGNLGKAAKCLKIQQALQPDSVEPDLNLSSFYIINGMEEEAIKVCKSSLKKHPTNIYLISNLVLALSNLGSFEYAVDFLKKLIVKQGDNSLYYKLMGDVYYEMEDYREAVASYNEALLKLKKKAADEYIADLYNGIAACYLELNSYKEALINYKKALKQSPKDVYTLLSIAQLYFYRLKDYKAALSHGKQLMELEPENGLVQYLIGLIYLQMENHEKARWYLYRARKSMPNYEPVYEAISLLRQKTRTKLDDNSQE